MDNEIIKKMQIFCDNCPKCEDCDEYCETAQAIRAGLDIGFVMANVFDRLLDN